MRKPLVDATGLVVNIIEWDPEISAGYQPPVGLTMHDEDPAAAIGGLRNPDGTYSPPEPPPEPDPEEPTETEQRLALLDDLIAAGVVDQAIKNGSIAPPAADWYTAPETSTSETRTP